MTNRLYDGDNLDVLRAALPTRPMEAEAAAVGRFEDEWGRHLSPAADHHAG